ncbi:helix-turn-helix domain-containing protein [Streptomyces longispororuber]
MVHTRMPVAHVGARVGFLDAANFNRSFHDRTGETPAVFRATRA